MGIDADKAKHHTVAIDGEGDVLWSVKVNNDQQAIVDLLARAAAVDGEVRWAVDLMSPVVALPLGVLLHARQPVVFVPGRTVNRIAAAFRVRAKPMRRMPGSSLRQRGCGIAI
nr:hypothetical protein GCM10020063_082210 [Dactylosporangium thailandense]